MSYIIKRNGKQIGHTFQKSEHAKRWIVEQFPNHVISVWLAYRFHKEIEIYLSPVTKVNHPVILQMVII